MENAKQGGARVSYKAESLEDIAGMFTEMAKREREQMQRATVQRERHKHLSAEIAYTNCARILRNTTMPCEVASVKAIQDALGTGEDGAALVEVARNAHSAEQELAALKRMVSGGDIGERSICHTLAEALLTASKCNETVWDDVMDPSVIASDDSIIGTIRRALSIAKQLKG